MPSIRTRSAAGLLPPKRAIASAPRLRSRLYLHHTVTPVTADPNADWRKVQQVAFGRDFADISYTFGVHPDGTILEGRSPMVEGGHTSGYNRTSHAIVLIGNYETQAPTEPLIQSVRWLRAELVRLGILTNDHAFGYHRQVSATACPGAKVWQSFATFQAPYVAPQPDPVPQPEPQPGEDDVVLPPTFGQGTSDKHHTGIMQANLIWHARDLVAMQMGGYGNVEGFVDGDFGPGTAAVLSAWQKRTGYLRTDGVCDPATYKHLAGV